MKRYWLLLALALGVLVALGAAARGPLQRTSDAQTSAAASNPLASPAATSNPLSPTATATAEAARNLLTPTAGATAAKSPSSSKGTVEKALSLDAAALSGKPNFFSTRGSKIVNAEGKEITISGINWFGLETGTFAPHGLWARNWEEMLDEVAKLGFNTIRLPYSNQLFDPGIKLGEGIDFKLNPDLQGLTGIEMMDKIVTGAGKRGLKVILDRHRPDAQSQSKLWYTDKYPEERWMSDWVMLAQRYKGNDTVIGADLHNEPAGNATWGTGDLKTDWRLAAERAGNAILDANSDWLIIVEGIEKSSSKHDDFYWMGGNLSDAGNNPVRLKVPNKLVYSAHDYGPGVYNQGWFMDKSFPSNMSAIWDAHWGYLVKQGTAPVLIGEFGGRSVGSDTEGIWQRNLVQYMKQHGISYTYWSLNPNSGDTGGVLKDDWKSPDEGKMSLLSAYRGLMERVSKPALINPDIMPKK